MKNKEQLEQYARENRKRLAKQEVKLGDVVKVLIGPFAGETGTIVGTAVCATSYDTPYYEVDMACEIPDKYKCHKGPLMSKSVSGLTACDFEVIGYHTPEKPTDEIKVGDRVKFKGKEELETMLGPSFWWSITLLADREAEIVSIPFNNSYRVDICPSLGGIRREFFDKIPKKQPNDHTITIPVKADLDDTYWDVYRAELVRDIAVKLADNNTITIPKICDRITDFATRIVDNLKKQSE
ncbi:MAG: hypothetical protein K2K82_08730 [Muribaculaceae bacterium]|nr:hypothetical protein [Muribaculaceae bacterium]